MIISDVRSGIMRLLTLLCFVIIVVNGQSLTATAADTAREEFQRILKDSLTAIWTGQEFSPTLKQRQQTLTSLLASGDVDKSSLSNMVESTILTIIDRHKTSRYVIKTFPEQISALFSPVMDWPDFESILWRSLASPVDPNNPISITIGTLGPPGTPWITVPETTAIPKIEKLSEGKCLIKIYGGGVMGEDTDVLKKMAAGQLNGCGCTALGVLEVSPETSALLLPGLFKNYEEIDYICNKFRKRLDKAFEKDGYILAAIIDTGHFYLFSKNKISTLNDLEKQSVLTWFGAVESMLLNELGTKPIPIAVPDIVSALSTGKGDASLAPAAWMLGMQAYQYVNFYLKPPLFYSPSAVFVTRDTINRVQKQLEISDTLAWNIQETIVSEITALEPEWNRQIRSYEQKSLKAFETKCGIKAMAFSTEDQQLIEKAGLAVQKNLAGKIISTEMINEIKKALAEYRARN